MAKGLSGVWDETMKKFFIFCFGMYLSGCSLSDRGLAKLQVVEDLVLGTPMEDVKQEWFLYSTKPLVVDQTMSTEMDIVYRGVSRVSGRDRVLPFFQFQNQESWNKPNGGIIPA